MKESSIPSFEAELRMSPRPVIALFLCPAIALALGAFQLPDSSKAMNLSLVLYAVSGATWLLTGWHDQIGRWATVLALAMVVCVVRVWMDVPGFLVLLVLPTALAAAVIDPKAALVTTLGETALLATPHRLLPAIGGGEAAMAVTVIWITLGAMCVAYWPVSQLAQWSWQRFEQARDLLEEARDRQAELKDALDALAHSNGQLALTVEKLARMRRIAEEAQKTKAAFVANVSHEFRTPLNMIIGLVDLLMETPEVYGQELPAELLEDLEIVHRNCEHLSSMINDVLDLSQIEASRLALHRDHVNLKDILDGALAVVRPLIDKKALSLQVIVPEDLPDLYCDAVRIRQVVLNLVSNAARFTEEGGITIQVGLAGQFVVTGVADTGSGISADDAQRIFEPFQQTSRKLWQHQDGSGLGLSISKRFVELHGGRMWLESTLGVGSTFSFKLPLGPLPGPVAPPERWITEGWVERRARADTPVPQLDQRVILCDPTGELHPLFSRYADHVEFADTRDLAQTIEELRRTAAQSIVINTRSPDELWPLVTEASARLPDVPVIGCALPGKMERASIVGARGYLLKPLKRADLRETLRGVAGDVRRVLVVDDEPDTLTLLTRMLRTCDGTMEVTTASNGRQALEEMRVRPPDLVLLDLVLPDIDGWQVLEAKAQDRSMQDIPVVIISAQDPHSQPVSSPLVLGAMGGGLSVSKLLRCSRELASLLLQPG